jgi:hypothetical protein
MRTIQLLILTFSVFAGTMSPAATTDSKVLNTYKASSAKFDGYIRDGKYGTAGGKYAARYKQIIDNTISATVLAKDCNELLAAAPTLRPGKYTVYPDRKRSNPQVVTCNPTDTASLIMMLNGED